jgi:AcrR family transcriptional regulator
MASNTSPPSRRRGEVLADALLDAAWNELVEVGYTGFTIEGVAARAGTSRPVIYRRWPARSDLAIAAIRHHGTRVPVVTPDTGSVRLDLIELLRNGSANRRALAVLFSVKMGEYFTETGKSPADLRAEFLGALQHPFGIDQVLRRGVERGEIDPGKLTPRIANLPTDLLRHELLMTLQPMPDEAIVEIVDDIFLPLVRVSATRPPAGSA